jgi:hypothetical protein
MTEPRRLPTTCPSCGVVAVREPYDIGSGPELSCAACEWCWGAQGQDLKPLVEWWFTCPRCGRRSYNENDIKERYCGACHDWTGPVKAEQ